MFIRFILLAIKYKPWHFIGLQFLLILTVAANLTIPLLMQQLTSAAADINSGGNVIFEYSGYMILAAVGEFILSNIMVYLFYKYTFNYITYVRMQVLNNYQNLAHADLSAYSGGSITRRLINNLNDLAIFSNMVLRLFMRAVWTIIGGFISTWYILYKSQNALLFVNESSGDNRWIILVAFSVILVIASLASQIFIFYSGKSNEKLQKALDQYYIISKETVFGIKLIKSYNLEEYQNKKFDKANNQVRKTSIISGMIDQTMSPFFTFIFSMTSLIILWVGWSINAINAINVLPIIQITSNSMMGILWLVFSLSNWGKSNIISRRVFELWKAKPSVNYVEQKTENNFANKVDIKFENVVFKFNQTARPILDNINLSIPYGSSLGIIGKTSAGKSTLISMLTRAQDCSSGSIKINNVDIKNIDKTSLLNLFGIVLQNNFLFSGSIKKNLAMGKNDATDSDMWNALELAQAKEFVEKKENKLDYLLTQGGNNLSGGQKQRMCIARALIKKPKVLILDDSTSALDAKTERKLINELQKQKFEQTKIIISQKISAIRFTDKILVLDAGKVVGLGKHEELLKSCSIYQEIANAQENRNE